MLSCIEVVSAVHQYLSLFSALLLNDIYINSIFYIGISRGKDMSNILGVSDEDEKPAKAAKKRRPRLTELDDTEGEGDDDTDDYQVSL